MKSAVIILQRMVSLRYNVNDMIWVKKKLKENGDSLNNMGLATSLGRNFTMKCVNAL